MRIVGIDFRDGILFVPEVLLSANAMKAGMTILRPLLAATGAPKQGKMVIGTVKGDIHDIGKNLVGMMMEGAGFDVIDLGINNPVENYLKRWSGKSPIFSACPRCSRLRCPNEGCDRHDEGKGHSRRLRRLGGGAPLNEEFGKAVVARCLLPRRSGRRGNGEGIHQPQAQQHGRPRLSLKTAKPACHRPASA